MEITEGVAFGYQYGIRKGISGSAGDERPMTAQTRQSGLTMMEILVLIAVIAILSALLLPGAIRMKAGSQRTVCLNNLKQVNLGVRMYADDFRDITPDTKGDPVVTNVPWIGYKELMKHYVGLRGSSSSNDVIFACPSDTFYYDWMHGLVSKPHHDQAHFDYSSYTFNGMNLHAVPTNLPFKVESNRQPGIGGLSMSAIRH